jgi:hypothetical protein
VINPYTSGSDINEAERGDYAGVYDLVYNNSTVVAFSQIQLAAPGAAPQEAEDAALSDLEIDGTTVTSFAPATLIYDVVLPAGATAVPAVTATVYDTVYDTDLITQAPGLPGLATVLVTARDGTIRTYTINFGFTVAPVLVSSITATGAGSATSVVNRAVLQMSATVLPTDAANPGVAWSVTADTGTATINATTGLLTATSVGAVTVTATANDASDITGSKTITVNPILVSSITI